LYSILIVAYVIVCIFLVLTVLLQQGKGAEIGAVFGSSDTIFGSAGPASFLHKITAGLAVFFMVFALILTYLSAHKVEKSIMQDVEVTTGTDTTEQSEISEVTETTETVDMVAPESVETSPLPVTGVEEPVQGLGEETDTTAEDARPKEDQPKNIIPSANQKPETSK
jgi:preprotein translocase subunit SecG